MEGGSRFFRSPYDRRERDSDFSRNRPSPLDDSRFQKKEVSPQTLAFASKRLMQDLREILKNPLPTVSALPISEGNLFLWHANVYGLPGTEYGDTCFHLSLEFPRDYPQSPPTVNMCTMLQHPHVYGNWICLDLLETYDNVCCLRCFADGIRTPLIRLQSFLFHEAAVEKVYVDWSKREARNYICNVCEHKGNKHWPPLASPRDVVVQVLIDVYNSFKKNEPMSLEVTNDGKNYIDIVADEIMVEIFGYLFPVDVSSASRVCRRWRSLSQDKYLLSSWEKQEIICFHTKLDWQQDVLGIGISVKLNKRTRAIAYITSPLDLISWTAYSQLRVRSGVWKEGFDYWMPLFINKNHGKRMKPLFKRAIANIATLGRSTEFEPMMALDILPKLMSTMVVNVMQGKLHASIKALEGYSAFHRLLIMLVEEYPILLKKANDTVAKFIARESDRTKTAVPALGEFLPLLTIANYSWEDIAVPYLQESFDRNALWAIGRYPELDKLESAQISDERLRKNFDAAQVSLRLLMFHVYFYSVARPEGQSLADVAANYDSLMGRPSFHMRESLQKAVFQIQKVSYWPEFFKRIGLGCPSREYLCGWLKKSIKNSEKKRYHTPGVRFVIKN